jgi:undecaprenyl-diphosphatase
MQKDTISAHTPTAIHPSARLPLPVLIGVAGLLILALALTVPFQSNWWQVVILGVVQGLTEFLPISSTAHLLITADLLGFEGSIGGTFEIFIQLGTVLAVFGFYLSNLLRQARAVLGWGSTAEEISAEETAAARRFWLSILVAFLPAAVVGLTFREQIKTYLFDAPQVIAASLIIGGIVFIVIERLPSRTITAHQMNQVTLLQALGIGLAQVLALVPGVSRSGSSIVGGLFAGLDRRTATAFSFYLAIPTLGAATVVDLLSSLDQITADDWGRLLLGTVVSMIVGWLSIGWLLRYVARHNFVAFGIYRIIAGLVILGLWALQWL